MDSKVMDDGVTAMVEFVVETVDVRHLNKLVQNMRHVPGVRDVQRVQKI
jgi:guanosine-3',5'-bis(diphosphate) 3'-pyrophosphohydrolase